MQVSICPQRGTVISVLTEKPITTLDFPAHCNFPFALPVSPRLLALSGRSTFTTKKARQGRWGGKEMVGLLNRWAELVPLARTSFHPCAQPLPQTPLTLNSSSKCYFLKLSKPFLKPEGGTAGSGRRVVESRRFNSSHHKLSHLSVNVSLWWNGLRREEETIAVCSLLPRLIQMSACSRWRCTFLHEWQLTRCFYSVFNQRCNTSCLCERPPSSTLESKVYFDIFIFTKCGLGVGLLLLGHQPFQHLSIYLRRVFKASEQCQMWESGMRGCRFTVFLQSCKWQHPSTKSPRRSVLSEPNLPTIILSTGLGRPLITEPRGLLLMMLIIIAAIGKETGDPYWKVPMATCCDPFSANHKAGGTMVYVAHTAVKLHAHVSDQCLLPKQLRITRLNY